MKFRLSKNSIRFRLSQEDIDILDREGFVENSIPLSQISSTLFKYSLIATKSKDLSSCFLNNHFRLFIPEDLIGEWINTDKIGFETTIEMAGGNPVNILIEKDFHFFKPGNKDND